MADRDLSVNVNVGGKDDLSPALERQKKLLGDLAAAEANLNDLRKQFGNAGADLVLQGLREQLAAERAVTQEKQKQATILQRPPPGPPGGGPPGVGAQEVGLSPGRRQLMELARGRAEAEAHAKEETDRRLGRGPQPYSPALAGGGLSDLRQQAKAEVEVRKEIVQQLREAKDREIREKAYAAVTGHGSPEAQRERQAEAHAREQALRAAAAVAPTLTRQALTFDRPAYGNEMAPAGRLGGMLSTIGGALPGPIGAAVTALGSLGQVAEALGEQFKRTTAGLAEMSSAGQERSEILRRARGSGVVGGEDLRVAFQGTAAVELMNAPGLTAQQRADRLLTYRNEAAVVARQQQELGRPRGADELVMEMMIQRNQARSGGAMTHGNQIRDILSRYGVSAAEIPTELENIYSRGTARAMTDQQIRQLAQAAMTGRLTQAQARVAAAEAVLQSGSMPGMNPNAPQLADLPNLFRSQQRDFLDVHDQVQQELVRDQREERRFQAQYALWERILRQLEASTFTPPPPLPVDVLP